VELIRAHEVEALSNPGVTSLQLLCPRNSRSQRVTITRVTVAAGAMNSAHRHPTAEQTWVALAGEGRLLLSEGREEAFAAGDIVRFEDGELHGLRNPGSVAFEYLSVTAPPIDFTTAYRGR
jgi:quercetin dioxygenase-like cupin family protein